MVETKKWFVHHVIVKDLPFQTKVQINKLIKKKHFLKQVSLLKLDLKKRYHLGPISMHVFHSLTLTQTHSQTYIQYIYVHTHTYTHI